MVPGKNIADFKSLINLALDNRIPWYPLKAFLNDLTSTLEASKELNVILFGEYLWKSMKSMKSMTNKTSH